MKETLAEGIELFCGDFREMPLRRVAHIISDPPYEQRSHDATGAIRRNDGTEAPKALTFEGVDLLRADLIRLAKNQCDGWAIFFCTTEGVAIWRDEIERQSLKYKTPCIWVKVDAMPKFNGQGPSHGHECFVTAWCGEGYSKWNGGGRRGVFTHSKGQSTRDGRHETEKPLSLMMELVALFTNPGDLVCDPCMGSGTTGVACIKLEENSSAQRLIQLTIKWRERELTWRSNKTIYSSMYKSRYRKNFPCSLKNLDNKTKWVRLVGGFNYESSTN